ncbi:hypothetical protein ABBQ32_010807 [Trebouxia sp. C0010 RCD-2024]
MLMQAGTHSEAEEASTVAITLCADTASTSRGYAMRANARWCQGNLLGAYEDLHTAWEAMQTVDVNYATNMSEDLEWLTMQITAPSEQPEGLHSNQDDLGLPTLEDVATVEDTETQELAELPMKAAMSETHKDHGCKSGSGDHLGKLDNDKAVSPEPVAATPQKQDKPSRPLLLHASDSTVRSKRHARTTNASASGEAQAEVKSPSHETSHLSATGGLAASLPELPKAVTSSGNSPFHAVDPNIHDTASSQSAQTPVKPSPFSPGHPHNVPGGHRALDVSDVVSPTPANGSSTAHSGGIAETLDARASGCLQYIPSPAHTAGGRSPAQASESPRQAKRALPGWPIASTNPEAAAVRHVWRNTALGVSLAIGCVAALLLCRVDAKRRP